jgi:hypothetical protein
VGAIDEEVQVFHDDGADEGCVAVGLKAGVVNAVAAEQGELDFTNHVFFAAPTVGVSDADLSGPGQAELIRNGGRQDETRGAAVDDAFDFGFPDGRRFDQAFLGFDDVRANWTFILNLRIRGRSVSPSLFK